MQFVAQFLQLYWNHLSGMDALILTLGAIVFGLQVREYRFLGTSAAMINQDLANAENRATNIVRVATLAIDGFPLLGLLGTVASLLVTFAGMKSSQAPTNIISDFAPGLTSTVSGLIGSITNLAFFQLGLVPSVAKLHGQRKRNG
jgi:hypothetical protein